MPEETPFDSAASDELQFEHAEYATDAAALPHCTVCSRVITDWYFSVNDQVACTDCRNQVEAAMSAGSGFGRFVKATGLGVAGGAVGAAIYCAILLLTGYELGLVAIVMGFLVGAGVRKGAQRRGGRGYQFLAVFITYLSIAMAFIPTVVQGLRESDMATTAPVEVSPPSDAQGGVNGSAADDTEGGSGGAMPDPAAEPMPLIWAILIAAIFSPAVPIVVGIESPISLLIYGIALYEAWKMNKRGRLEITGPFPVEPVAEGGLPSDGSPRE